jgi:hypothetical protein
MLSYSLLKYIYYFSDGCAGQYMNRKNFINLYHHNADFGIEAEWNFFATDHGKGPPDAVGGNSKRLMKLESLRGTDIVTAADAYQWCSEHVKKIRYILVTSAEVERTVEMMDLTTRYLSLTNIHGTQQCHRIYIRDNQIMVYETSEVQDPLTIRKTGNDNIQPVIVIDESMRSDWMVRINDNKWCVGIVRDINMDDNEVEVDVSLV